MAFTSEAVSSANRRPDGLGAVDPGTVLAVAKGVQVVGGYFDKGSKGPYPLVNQGNKIDQSRAARADSYLVGAQHGSVTSARLALGARQTQGASTERALYDHILQVMASTAGATLTQARALGPLFDAGDGRQGLQELWALQIPFTDAWAGHNTADGSVLDPSTIELANRLAQLAGGGPGVTASGGSAPSSGGGSTPTGGGVPSSGGGVSTTPFPVAQAGTGNLLGLGLLGAAAYLLFSKRR